MYKVTKMWGYKLYKVGKVTLLQENRIKNKNS